MLSAHQILFFESPLLTVGICLLSMLLGLIVGSLAHRISWRITHDPSLGSGARCHVCGHPLSLRESLPLIGWLKQGGICPYCGEPMGIDKPLCELLCAGIYASVVLRHGIGLMTVEVLAIVTILFVICLSALWDYHIPNSCIALAFLVRIAYLIALAILGSPEALPLAVSSVVGALALGIPLALAVFLSNAMLARDITGMGTVKLVAVVGFYLGWQQGLIAIAAAAALWVFVWVLSPSKVLEVEVAGGPHRGDDADAEPVLNPRDLHATLEEDIAEPMRLIPFAPPVAISLWVMLLLGVTPSVWNAPIF